MLPKQVDSIIATLRFYAAPIDFRHPKETYGEKFYTALKDLVYTLNTLPTHVNVIQSHPLRQEVYKLLQDRSDIAKALIWDTHFFNDLSEHLEISRQDRILKVIAFAQLENNELVLFELAQHLKSVIASNSDSDSDSDIIIDYSPKTTIQAIPADHNKALQKIQKYLTGEILFDLSQITLDLINQEEYSETKLLNTVQLFQLIKQRAKQDLNTIDSHSQAGSDNQSVSKISYQTKTPTHSVKEPSSRNTPSFWSIRSNNKKAFQQVTSENTTCDNLPTLLRSFLTSSHLNDQNLLKLLNAYPPGIEAAFKIWASISFDLPLQIRVWSQLHSVTLSTDNATATLLVNETQLPRDSYLWDIVMKAPHIEERLSLIKTLTHLVRFNQPIMNQKEKSLYILKMIDLWEEDDDKTKIIVDAESILIPLLQLTSTPLSIPQSQSASNKAALASSFSSKKSQGTEHLYINCDNDIQSNEQKEAEERSRALRKKILHDHLYQLVNSNLPNEDAREIMTQKIVLLLNAYHTNDCSASFCIWFESLFLQENDFEYMARVFTILSIDEQSKILAYLRLSSNPQAKTHARTLLFKILSRSENAASDMLQQIIGTLKKFDYKNILAQFFWQAPFSFQEKLMDAIDTESLENIIDLLNIKISNNSYSASDEKIIYTNILSPWWEYLHLTATTYHDKEYFIKAMNALVALFYAHPHKQKDILFELSRLTPKDTWHDIQTEFLKAIILRTDAAFSQDLSIIPLIIGYFPSDTADTNEKFYSWMTESTIYFKNFTMAARDIVTENKAIDKLKDLMNSITNNIFRISDITETLINLGMPYLDKAFNCLTEINHFNALINLYIDPNKGNNERKQEAAKILKMLFAAKPVQFLSLSNQFLTQENIDKHTYLMHCINWNYDNPEVTLLPNATTTQPVNWLHKQTQIDDQDFSPLVSQKDLELINAIYQDQQIELDYRGKSWRRFNARVKHYTDNSWRSWLTACILGVPKSPRGVPSLHRKRWKNIKLPRISYRENSTCNPIHSSPLSVRSQTPELPIYTVLPTENIFEQSVNTLLDNILNGRNFLSNWTDLLPREWQESFIMPTAKETEYLEQQWSEGEKNLSAMINKGDQSDLKSHLLITIRLALCNTLNGHLKLNSLSNYFSSNIKNENAKKIKSAPSFKNNKHYELYAELFADRVTDLKKLENDRMSVLESIRSGKKSSSLATAIKNGNVLILPFYQQILKDFPEDKTTLCKFRALFSEAAEILSSNERSSKKWQPIVRFYQSLEAEDDSNSAYISTVFHGKNVNSFHNTSKTNTTTYNKEKSCQTVLTN